MERGAAFSSAPFHVSSLRFVLRPLPSQKGIHTSLNPLFVPPLTPQATCQALFLPSIGAFACPDEIIVVISKEGPHSAFASTTVFRLTRVACEVGSQIQETVE
jgi:hypothetical protein